MRVKDLLRKKGNAIYSIKPDNTVYEAIEKMADLNVGALLVMEDNHLAGIISERDYRNKVILKGRTSKTTFVRDIMTSELIIVKATDEIGTCMQLMTDQHIRHLPVMESDDVIGVISIGDVVKAVIEDQKVEIDSLKDYISTGYMQ